MKLIIQIPCYNEEQLLGTTIGRLPRVLPGIDEVEWLVVDDGSTDATVQVAKVHGVDHVVSHSKNLGLARAFVTGLEACLARGADIIVNIDADNQHRAEYIPELLRPILEGRADMVVGARMIDDVEDYSAVKKVLHRVGCWAVRMASGTSVPDAPSGFRALTREAAMRTRVYSRYTYTLETIIQAGQHGLNITWVPIETNPAARPSRLIRSISSYVLNCLMTIIRIFVVYRPFRFFFSLGATLFVAGALLGIRYLWVAFVRHDPGHVQSLILASILIGIGFQTITVAFVADPQVLRRAGLRPEERIIFIRTVSWGATHDHGRAGLGPEQLTHLVEALSHWGRVIVSSEAPLPPALKHCENPVPVAGIHHLLAFATLCLVEGGTMAAEAAVLGTPTICLLSYDFGYLIALERDYQALCRTASPRSRYRPGGYDDNILCRTCGVLPAHSRRARRGGPAHREQTLAVPRGGQPRGGQPCCGPALRPHGAGETEPAEGGNRYRQGLRDRQPGDRRPAHRDREGASAAIRNPGPARRTVRAQWRPAAGAHHGPPA